MLVSAGCVPVPRQEFGELGVRMIVDAGEDIGDPGLEADVVQLRGDDQGIHGGCPLAAAVGSGEHPGAPS